MRKDKEEATKLRLAGKSYREIMEALRVPPATLSGWFGKEEWSKKIRQRLTQAAQEQHTLRIRALNKVRGQQLELAYDEARRVAAEEFELLKYNPLFIAGMMLYWGEGDKGHKNQTRLSNTDPAMLRLYRVFLEHVCRVEQKKIHGHVLTYPDVEDSSAISYWSISTGIPAGQFIKCTSIEGRHPTRRLEYGVCILYVSNSYFKVKMLTWLDLMSRELISRRYYENIEPEADIV